MTEDELENSSTDPTTNDSNQAFEKSAKEVRRAKKLGKHDCEGGLPTPWLPDPKDVPPALHDDAPWICWAFEWTESGELTKVPRDGNGGGDYRASATDPDNWTDFETALATAKRNGWGIGPVFDSSNAFLGIDIDDGRDPANGRPTDDAKDIIGRLDTWTEVSVSGTGYHPIALGELPDGGNRGDGVEMYDDARFFAFTGVHVKGTPTDIQNRQDAIEAVHRDYVADDPNPDDPAADPQSDTEASNPDPQQVADIPDSELIRRAKDADDGGYFADLWEGNWQRHTHRWQDDSQSEADAALCSKLAFWTAGDKGRIDRLFRNSALHRDKWDRDDYRDRTINGAIQQQSEYYSPPGRDRNSRTHTTASTPAADGGTATATGTDPSSDPNPGGSNAETGKKRLANPTSHEFEVRNGGYGYWRRRDDKDDEWVEWTNFEIEVESFLSLEDGSEEIELTVHPRNGEEYTVTVEPTVFNERREFKREVACGRTTTFTGHETALAKIKRFVGTQAAPELQGVRQMGRRNGELVLPAGSLTSGGWVDEPSHRYVTQSLGIERKVQLSPENDDIDEDDVRSILELLPQTRNPQRFLPAMGWFYAVPLRPVITEETGEFPVLSVTGGTGAGKTSTLETMWELLGVGGDPFSANGTTFTSMRTVSATDTLPVWFDEYKPSDIHPGRLDGFHDIIRKSTKGGVVPKGNPDGTTTEHIVKAPVVVSGEQRFAGPAEQRRSVLTTFRESSTDPDGDMAHAFARLAGGSYRMDDGRIKHYDGHDLTAHAHAYHRWLLGHAEEEVVEAWHDAEERVLTLLDNYGLGGVDSAGRTALQTIALGVALYRKFAEEMGASVPFDEDDEDRALTYVAKQQGDDGHRESHLDEFVRLLSLATMDNEIEEGRHYTRTCNQRTGDWEIRVNMSRSYPKVARYVQNHGLSDTTEWLDEGDYRERIKEAVEVDDSYITCYSQRSDPVGRAFGIHIPSASETIEAFDDDHFYGRKEMGSNGRYDDDPDEKHWRGDVKEF